MTTDGDMLRLSVTLNAEAIVAGADLEGVEDTNALELSDEIDALRALSPEELGARLSEMRGTLTDRIEIDAGTEAVPLTMTEISPGPVGNVEIPRDTVLGFGRSCPQAPTASS